MNYLKFWGTRGSCSVSGDQYETMGGNTCCLEINYDSHRLIIDAGTGIRPLGHVWLAEGEKHFNLFLSHTHWDHLIGFPFFEPLYQSGTIIDIWSPISAGRSCHDLFDDLLAQEFFPVRLNQIQAEIHFHTIHPRTPIQVGPITLDFHATHHPGTTYCFKIITPNQTIGYVTDNEMLYGYHGPIDQIPPTIREPYQSLIDFLAPCDILIHEAQYTPEDSRLKVGWGHSSIPNAAALLLHTKCPRWIITHHEPQHSDETIADMATQAEEFLRTFESKCKVSIAHDGLELKL